MKLATLVPDHSGLPDIEISGLAIDSRRVQPGDLFAAFSGTSVDGRAYIDDAIARGAHAVLTTPGHAQTRAGIAMIADPNPRARMAQIAARFYGRQPDTIVGVTGTNGKTSVVDMCRQLWQIIGQQAASIGTLGIISSRVATQTGMTTPDVLTFQKSLATLASQGCTALAFEASSHALDQYRLDGAQLQAAGFTNLSRDHLDYHGSMEEYGAAKARLFLEVLPPAGVAVINMDDAFGVALMPQCTARGLNIIGYGTNGRELQLLENAPAADGQQLRLSWQGADFDLKLPLVGAFQAENALCALGLVLACGAQPDAAFAAAEKLQPVPGRMEFAGRTRAGAGIYVDYAHTPDGLRAALVALRRHTPGSLHVVFGCGGDRDRGKRPQMGEVAALLADTAIITDDNPRSELPSDIHMEIAAGAPAAQIIGDRALAIAAALDAAQSGDSVLIAGKGHETGQTIGSTVFAFNDGDVVRAYLAASS